MRYFESLVKSAQANVVKATWNPTDHPRWPKGTIEIGGQFRPDGMPDSAAQILLDVFRTLNKNDSNQASFADAVRGDINDVEWNDLDAKSSGASGPSVKSIISEQEDRVLLSLQNMARNERDLAATARAQLRFEEEGSGEWEAVDETAREHLAGAKRLDALKEKIKNEEDLSSFEVASLSRAVEAEAERMAEVSARAMEQDDDEDELSYRMISQGLADMADDLNAMMDNMKNASHAEADKEIRDILDNRTAQYFGGGGASNEVLTPELVKFDAKEEAAVGIFLDDAGVEDIANWQESITSDQLEEVVGPMGGQIDEYHNELANIERVQDRPPTKAEDEDLRDTFFNGLTEEQFADILDKLEVDVRRNVEARENDGGLRSGGDGGDGGNAPSAPAPSTPEPSAPETTGVKWKKYEGPGGLKLTRKEWDAFKEYIPDAQDEQGGPRKGWQDNTLNGGNYDGSVGRNADELFASIAQDMIGQGLDYDREEERIAEDGDLTRQAQKDLRDEMLFGLTWEQHGVLTAKVEEAAKALSNDGEGPLTSDERDMMKKPVGKMTQAELRDVLLRRGVLPETVRGMTVSEMRAMFKVKKSLRKSFDPRQLRWPSGAIGGLGGQWRQMWENSLLDAFGPGVGMRLSLIGRALDSAAERFDGDIADELKNASSALRGLPDLSDRSQRRSVIAHAKTLVGSLTFDTNLSADDKVELAGAVKAMEDLPPNGTDNFANRPENIGRDALAGLSNRDLSTLANEVMSDVRLGRYGDFDEIQDEFRAEGQKSGDSFEFWALDKVVTGEWEPQLDTPEETTPAVFTDQEIDTIRAALLVMGEQQKDLMDGWQIVRNAPEDSMVGRRLAFYNSLAAKLDGKGGETVQLTDVDRNSIQNAIADYGDLKAQGGPGKPDPARVRQMTDDAWSLGWELSHRESASNDLSGLKQTWGNVGDDFANMLEVRLQEGESRSNMIDELKLNLELYNRGVNELDEKMRRGEIRSDDEWEMERSRIAEEYLNDPSHTGEMHEEAIAALEQREIPQWIKNFQMMVADAPIELTPRERNILENLPDNDPSLAKQIEEALMGDDPEELNRLLNSALGIAVPSAAEQADRPSPDEEDLAAEIEAGMGSSSSQESDLNSRFRRADEDLESALQDVRSGGGDEAAQRAREALARRQEMAPEVMAQNEELQAKRNAERQELGALKALREKQLARAEAKGQDMNHPVSEALVSELKRINDRIKELETREGVPTMLPSGGLAGPLTSDEKSGIVKPVSRMTRMELEDVLLARGFSKDTLLTMSISEMRGIFQIKKSVTKSSSPSIVAGLLRKHRS